MERYKMKPWAIILIHLSILCSIASGLEATTADGKKVILNDDGTWEYAKQKSTKVTKGLNRSDKQVLENFDDFFPYIEETTDVKGKARRMGKTADSLAFIELIGDPRNLHSVSVMIGIPSDDQATIARNIVICLAVIKNTLPNWPEGTDWFNEALEKIIHSFTKTSEEITLNDKTVSLTLHKELGMCTLTIKHKENIPSQPSEVVRQQ
jgi:hypothetical protein